MLEQSVLLLQSWQPESTRAVAQVRPLLLPWLARRTLVIHEAPDASLVFTLRRSWGWPSNWQVLDADEHLVGTLHGRAIMDGLGNLLAVIEAPDPQGRGRLLAVNGQELASFALDGETTRVIFTGDVDGNPFAKMMLLGAVLTRQE
jgi:hypothetical protein